MRATRAAMVVALTITVLALAGCGGDDGATTDPQAALDTAGQLLDEATSVRFTVEGEDLPVSGTIVVAAEGVAAPPGSFDGEVRVKVGALPATIPVISVNGQLWAQLPLTDGFDEIDAGELGFGDPGTLIDPDKGVGLLLESGSEVVAGEQVRIDGDVYDQVTSVLPGDLVDAILTLDDPSADVRATWALDQDSGQLRQATLTGPFYEGGEQTYTVRLDDYDEPVEISAPTD